MPVTLKLFKATPKDIWQANTAVMPTAKPVMSATSDLHNRQILREEDVKMNHFILSNN